MPPGAPTTALHIFDMDGTLLRDSTANLEISRRLGRVDAMAVLEDRFAAGEITALELGSAICGMWAELTDDVLTAVVDDAPWIEGIDDVCADIAARGETSMLITMSPDFFARHLHRRGIDVVHAATYPALPLTPDAGPVRALHPEDKVRHTEAERARLGLPASACVAYGDAMSDLPLFAHLDRTVAINAEPRVEDLAHVAYRGDDLREAYAHGRRLLEEAPG